MEVEKRRLVEMTRCLAAVGFLSCPLLFRPLVLLWVGESTCGLHQLRWLSSQVRVRGRHRGLDGYDKEYSILLICPGLRPACIDRL